MYSIFLFVGGIILYLSIADTYGMLHFSSFCLRFLACFQ